ncbi:iron complex transport system ATP-binding protein [Fontibacillus phaseoli]|uniref:Iron complex transport system ATP-binding protein n=1 Tax=Fontibacillus phaseoli TaxID=1416533 RepID=A0A369BRY7_9BACL|nr:ABC transporter ATP-binding protein [Fontibacillus phaseoli]RCX23438.1 iron complex transport system ATP-binding protein [Fontibacillus phaseoli]
MQIIGMNGVSWSRDHKMILNEIEWQVNEGEHWAILGLNGSGKTTLLNMINGYIWPSSGQVSVLGHPFGSVDLRELRKSIGWVSSSFQERLYASDKSQHIVISGKHASIGLYAEPNEEDFDKAKELMERLSCGHLYDRSYQSCSQGEKQKLLIARALMASPKLLILDEATNGLDFLSREALLSSISELASGSDAPTMLFVTHHIEEILPIFNKTLLIRKGELYSQGNSEAMLTSENLTSFFETPVQVQWQNQRAWMTIPQEDRAE